MDVMDNFFNKVFNYHLNLESFLKTSFDWTWVPESSFMIKQMAYRCRKFVHVFVI